MIVAVFCMSDRSHALATFGCTAQPLIGLPLRIGENAVFF
jgi:hypothetical protein